MSKIMSKTKTFSLVVLAAVLAGAAYAGPNRGGPGGAPHGGGGGAPHVGGGGGMPHAMGGGAPHFGGGAPRFSGGAPHGGGGPHFGGAHFGGGGPRFGGVHVGGAPRGGGGQHFAARPNTGGRHASAGHGDHFPRGAAANANRTPGLGGGHDRASAEANRSADVRPNVRTSAVRNALNSHAVAGALHNPAALRFPNARAQIAASAATAGWREGHGAHGWWRHRNGGFGWVGPLFWPFAYDDLSDYTLWGYGPDDSFWDYGYNDIYAGIFSPYGYDDLAGYWPQENGVSGGARVGTRAGESKAAPPEQLAQMCGEDSRDIAGLPLDQIQAAIAPNDAQRAALDDLANASVKAAQDVKAACPTQIALTAPARIAAMQQRIDAMIAAVGTVQPPLRNFYDLLNDEQKARLNALGDDQRRADTAKNKSGSLTETCGAAQANVAAWPGTQIEAKVHPTEAQRASLSALQDATAKAADMLKTSCPANDAAITPPARLDAVGKRLEVMQQAVKTVRTALDDFYGKLSDEQKAQFEALGPRRTAAAEQPGAPPTHVAHARHHHIGYAGLIRRLMSMARW
jgi:LTXXQ motif family protein